jgi:hypothetical protein
MANTTNYNWETPDNTDLVKDGALAIRTLGSSIDTTTKALNPSTTLGDIEYRSATANTNTRLAIGSTGDVLTVAGGVPTWAAAAGGGGLTLLSTTTLSGSSTTISSINQTYKNLYVEMENVTNSAGNETFCNINNSVGDIWGVLSITTATAGSSFQGYRYVANDDIPMTGNIKTNNNSNNFWSFNFYNYASTTTKKTFDMMGGYVVSAGQEFINFMGYYVENTAITSLKFTPSGGGSWSAGTVRVYGVK